MSSYQIKFTSFQLLMSSPTPFPSAFLSGATNQASIEGLWRSLWKIGTKLPFLKLAKILTERTIIGI